METKVGTLTIPNCARCGDRHEHIDVHELLQAHDDTDMPTAPTHFAACPKTWQPILIWMLTDAD